MAHEFEKEQVAKEAIKLVKNDTIIGIGTGSSVQPFIRLLLEKLEKQKLNIKCIATSFASQKLLHGKISLIDPALQNTIDITFDGADEVDADFTLIKGGGGALLREKLVATQSKENITLIDESKLVAQLHKHPLPVEIIPFGYESTIKRLEKKGFLGQVRRLSTGLLCQSDNDNLLYDINLKEPIINPSAMHAELKSILGVVETGLFIKTTHKLLIGRGDGTVTFREDKKNV